MGEIHGYSEDVSEYAKRQKFGRSTPRQCWDWIVVSGNSHYARDQSSFKTYRRVAKKLRNNIFNPHDELLVEGIGTVELSVCRSPQDDSSHVIVLENVLHI